MAAAPPTYGPSLATEAQSLAHERDTVTSGAVFPTGFSGKPAPATSADAIPSRIKVQIVEGQHFERSIVESHTLIELMKRYEKEHVARKIRHRGLKLYGQFRGFFGRTRFLTSRRR